MLTSETPVPAQFSVELLDIPLARCQGTATGVDGVVADRQLMVVRIGVINGAFEHVGDRCDAGMRVQPERCPASDG